jgi:epidermal growth factor receptor substrate 15
LSSYKKALGVKPGDSAAQAKIDETNKSILDKQNAEQKEKDFAGFVAKGETAFNAKNYQESKVNYNKALDIKIDTQVQTKIKEIDKLIAEEKLAAKQKALFDNTIKEADDLFTENDYQSALLKYQKANSIKDSQHANDRILDINKKLLDLKEKQELEQKFNDLVTKGNTYKTDKKNQLALDTYKEALAVKPDPAISEYIRELNTLIEEENQNKSKDQAYSDKISLADTKFGESDWEQAKGYYEQAKLLKPEETYPGERIAICNDKINEAAILKTDNEYQKIIDKADNYFNNNSYDEAISYYQSALDKRPNDPYPQEKIDAIKKINNDLVNSKNNAVKLEKEYNDLVKSADVLYNAENYEKALIKYKEAYSKKPTDNYVSQRITDIEGKLKNKVVQRNSNSEYDKLIIEADALMNPGTWANALSKYKKAQIFKPNEGYPKGQIILCKNMMGKENTGQEEKEYQEILAAAQKNLDEENFDKAKELYKKAKGMRPSDPIPQRKIDEINQILKNRKSSGTYDTLISKADNLLEKKEWKDARKYYVQAYNLKNEAYPDKQIKKIDAANTEMFEKEYNKMITKADEYMGKQNYEKSKGLYLRAIKLLPNFDNSYPNQKLQEINNILNPPLATNNGLRNLGDPTVGVSDQDMQAKLDDAEKQRKYSIIQKVVNSNTELVSHKQNWSDKELEAAEKTKTIIVAIEEDVIQQSWEAEVQRVEATIAVEEQTEEYNEVQNEIAIYVEHGIFKQKELVENARLERTENNLNADVSRLKYEEEVVRIQTNVENQSELNVNAQTNEIYDNKEYVNFISDSHVTNDPNLDVARKNTEVKVVDMGVRIVNAQSQDAWNQEDITYETKNNVNLMVDEQIASRINSDIPREDMEDKVVDVTEGKSAYQDNLGRNQFDVVYDIKSYTDNAQEEISIATMSSDVPRQKMENEKVRIEEEMASESYAYTTNQSSANNNSKDYLDDEQKIQSEVFNEKDDERADDAENVIEIQDDIAQIQSNLVDDNQDVSFKTKDYADNQQVINTNAHINGDNKTKKNQDRSSEMVEDLNNSKVIDAENNEKKVNKTEDYILKLKDIDLDKIDVYVKNKLGEEYPNGVTEEIYEQYDNQGLLISFVTRRLVVVEGEGNIYERTKARYGVSYTKNGEGITEMLWDDETNNAYLVRN